MMTLLFAANLIVLHVALDHDNTKFRNANIVLQLNYNVLAPIYRKLYFL